VVAGLGGAERSVAAWMVLWLCDAAAQLPLGSRGLPRRLSARTSVGTFRFPLLRNALPFGKAKRAFRLSRLLGCAEAEKEMKRKSISFFLSNEQSDEFVEP